MVDLTQPLTQTLVIIPTYNEAPNIESIIGRLRASVPSAHVLVADDNSPDGTGVIADKLAAADGQVHVMHRKGKEGLGAAYLAGFAWGLSEGYDVLVEMDADGSHQPEQLPLMLDALKSADMVKGSRYVKGGSVVNWPAHRKLISRGGSIYSRVVLGVPVNDMTGGFSAFRASALRTIGLDEVASAGYCFQIDLVRRAHAKGLVIKEVPIEFIERELGESKMSQAIVAEALVRTTTWGLKHRARQVVDLTDHLFGDGRAKKAASEAREKVEPVVRKAAAEAQSLVEPAVKKVADAVQPGVDRVVEHLPHSLADRLHSSPSPRRGADDVTGDKMDAPSNES